MTCAGAVREPFIDTDDIADVVVAALTDARHADHLYEATDPRALTGRPVGYIQISPDDFAVGLRPYVEEEIVELLHELFTVVLDGRNEQVMHGVEEALGRPARDFADFARRTAASGPWNG